jgi:hypothetical protein
MEQADKMGIEIFVHALREGAELYKRMGFRLIAELVQDDCVWWQWGVRCIFFHLSARIED